VSDAEDLRLAASDSGIDLSASTVCHACGARNNGGQTACWQCRAPLAKALQANLHTAPSSSHSRTAPLTSSRVEERFLLLATLLVTVTAIGLSVWLLQQSLSPARLPARSLGQLFSGHLVTTRIALGMLLIAGWPLVLQGAAAVLRLRFKRPGHFLSVIGVLVGGSTYALSFIPEIGLAVALVLPPIVSVLLFHRILRLRLGASTGLCVVQFLTMALVITIATWGLESVATGRLLNPARELPAILFFANQPANVARQVLPLPNSNAFAPFRWRTSGSDWLDHRANQMLVEVSNSDRADTWNISLRAEGAEAPVDSVQDGNSPWRSTPLNPSPGVYYRISIDSKIAPGDVVQIFSLLPFESP
jgi:hypothetical protein